VLDACAKHWQSTGKALAKHWQSTGKALAKHWQSTGTALAKHWQSTGTALAQHTILKLEQIKNKNYELNLITKKKKKK